MPVLSITVTSEVIDYANNLIQEGRGIMVLARRQDRWELLPITEVAKIALEVHAGRVPYTFVRDGLGINEAIEQPPLVRGADLKP